MTSIEGWATQGPRDAAFVWLGGVEIVPKPRSEKRSQFV